MYSWDVGNFAATLEPSEDVVKELSTQYGNYGAISEYPAKSQGLWWAVPSVKRHRHRYRSPGDLREAGARFYSDTGTISDPEAAVHLPLVAEGCV